MEFVENFGGGGLCYMTAGTIGTVHAFTTRYGGVSDGVFASLNLGIERGDEPERVLENYDIICKELGIAADDIVCSRQVHGAEIRVVTRADCGKLFSREPQEADGLITAEKGVALAVFTADCTPILLYDPNQCVIGAVHAGWRGTVAGIAGNAVLKMCNEFGCESGDICAAVGPCISKCCFETGGEVARAVYELLGSAAEQCVGVRGDKKMVDLKRINRLLLMRAGVMEENIAVSEECTSCSNLKYWSHRRTNGVRGSQAAIIVMRGNT